MVESINMAESVPVFPVSSGSSVNSGLADFVSTRAGTGCPVMEAMASAGSPNGSFSSGKVSDEAQMSGYSPDGEIVWPCTSAILNIIR